jgi:hypothetical protein
MSMFPLNSTATSLALFPPATSSALGAKDTASSHHAVNNINWSTPSHLGESPASLATFVDTVPNTENTAVSVVLYGQAMSDNEGEEGILSNQGSSDDSDDDNNNTGIGSIFGSLFRRRLEPDFYKTKARRGEKRFCDAVRETKKVVRDGICTTLEEEVQSLIDDTHDAKHYRRPEKYTYFARQAATLERLKKSNNVTQNCSVWTNNVRDNLYDQSKRYREFTGFRDGRKASTK